ncbi:hypothetical protein AbraIFM66950_009252 [Aspergillus brasiliensis]|nr:hypothetical protein AbraIFM66950_009252 [Aspergillus brasiliensis]
MALISSDLPLDLAYNAIYPQGPKVSSVPRLRIMASGKCTFVYKSGKAQVHCPCEKGEFHLSSTVDPNKKCGWGEHTLDCHEDAMTIETSVLQRTQKQVDEDKTDTETGYDCLIADNGTVCPRQHTVTEGTPASGKTTLAHLLRDRLQHQGRLAPFFYTWDRDLMELDPEPWNALAKAFRQRLPGVHIPTIFNNEVVMIVDEAQGSYDGDYLWNSIIKSLADGICNYKLRICLFCYCGDPSTGVEPPLNCRRYTPVNIPQRQRITLTPQLCSKSPKIGLFYTEPEFDDVLDRIIRYEFPNLVVTFDDEARRYVFSLTNGHPGGVTAMIRLVCSPIPPA